MVDLSVTTEQAAALYRLLKVADGLLTAREIGQRLQLIGSTETQRRKVRAIVQQLRDDCGAWVIGFSAGYWLTEDERDWLDYQEGREIDAKKIIGKAYQKKKMVTDNRGQGLLFMR